MSKKKILFHSNCSRVLSGFGKNARNVLCYLYKTGKYEIVELANGVQEDCDTLKLFPWKTIGTFPKDKNIESKVKTNQDLKNKAGYGHLTIDKIIEREKPDVYIGAEDIWAFNGFWNKRWWRQIKTIIWTTLDSSPILKTSFEAARNSDHFVTWSKFPQEELKQNGISNSLFIHGPIDSSNFYKINESEKSNLRKIHRIKESDFVIGFVFRNQLRKSVSNLLEGFSIFKKSHANAKLLLHTSWEEGWDIPSLIKEKGINNEDVLTTYFCKECGMYEIKPFQGESMEKPIHTDCKFCGAQESQKTIDVHDGPNEYQLNEIYNLMDVYCHPFTSGGQEIPIQEAKLCELITLVTDYSCGQDCSNEDCGSLPLSWTEYREQGTQFIKASTSPESINSKLKKVFKMNKDKKIKMGKAGRDFILKNYSIENSCNKLMEIIDSHKNIEWDYKISSLAPDFSIDTPEGLSNKDFILFLYNKMLKVKISEKDEVFHFLIKKLNSGTSRDSIIKALKSNTEKAENSKKEKFDIKKYIDYDRPNKRLAFVLPRGIGDIFLASSLFEDAKATYPGYDLYFITRPQFFSIIESNPFIHKLIPYDPVCSDALYLEGYSNRSDREDGESFFDIAIILNVNNQRVLNYTRNGQDKISLDLCI